MNFPAQLRLRKMSCLKKGLPLSRFIQSTFSLVTSFKTSRHYPRKALFPWAALRGADQPSL